MFNIKRLKELQLKLYNEKKLARVWSFYMDHFSDHAEFLEVGKPTRHSLLEEVVPMLSKQLVGENPSNLFLILIPEYQFIHGGFTVGKRIGGVIYFEETLKGMVALSSLPPSGVVNYSRFTGQKMS
jgi:hypothetical protein